MKKSMGKKNSEASSGSSSVSKMGFVCRYQMNKKSSQFGFMHIHDRDVVTINHQLSFCAENHARIVSSSNGLLLLLTNRKKSEFIYHVFNPQTREIFRLPLPCITGSILMSVLAVFDEQKNYQVVVLHFSAGLELGIFSSETEKWKTLKLIDLFLPLPVKDMFPKLTALPLSSNGVIHWEILGHLLICDARNSRCKLIKLPYVADKWCSKSKNRFPGCLWESEGRVHYCYADTDGVHIWYLLSEQELDYYSMYNIDREQFSWALADSLDHQTLRKKKPEIFQQRRGWKPQDLTPFAYNDNSQTMYMQLLGTVISYNMKTRALEEVCSFKFSGKDFDRCSLFPFVYSNGQYGFENIDETSEEKRTVIQLPLRGVVNSMSF